MGFVHTFAHYFRLFSIFSVVFQICFYENVYVMMGSEKTRQTKLISIKFDLP